VPLGGSPGGPPESAPRGPAGPARRPADNPSPGKGRAARAACRPAAGQACRRPAGRSPGPAGRAGRPGRASGRPGRPGGAGRADPPNFLAIEVKDYGKSFPGKAVLLDEVLERLRGYFSDVAWQPKAPATLDQFDKNEKLGGEPALALEFEASLNTVPYEGEC